MISQSITAVVLPAGVSHSGKPLANIYLSPRLAGAKLLSAFPDWLNWTTLLHQHGLRIDLAGGGQTATVAIDKAVLRPDIWQAVFAHDSIVDEHATADDFDKRVVISYPSRDALDYLRYAYQSAATAPTGYIAERIFESILEDLSFHGDDDDSTIDAELSRLRVDMWNEQRDSGDSNGASDGPAPIEVIGAHAPLSKPPATRSMVERLALYHRLPPAPGRPPLPGKPHELERLIDFHQALTALAAYPRLLPSLGLVFAVELPAKLCPDSPAAGAYLSVGVTGLRPGWKWTHKPQLDTPATAYTLGKTDFAAAPATLPDGVASGSIETSDVVAGFLALTDEDFHLVGVDIDGAMLKAISLAQSVIGNFGTSLVDGLLPSLRSSGISLVADGRAQELLRAIRENKSFSDGGLTRALNARDVTRGYRLDVFCDRTGKWHSLHRRDGTYRFGDPEIALQINDDEGFTQLAVVQPADDPTRPIDETAQAAGAPQPSTDLYVNERVARWNGWSLSAPRPGLPLNRSSNPSHAVDEDPTIGQSVTTFSVKTAFAAHPGTLPSLRFGRRYRIRARAVDLAGRSVQLSATAPDELVAPADGMLPYYRYEPVNPPIVVLRELPGLGASLQHLVIRTHNSDPSLDGVAIGDADDRHVAPPRVAEQMVEHHGMLDDSSGRLRGDLTTYQMVTQRDRGELPVVGQDPLEPGPQLAVPYLADPIARGAAFTGLPQTKPGTLGTVGGGGTLKYSRPDLQRRSDSVTQVSFGSGWPEREAFRIRLVEGNAPPAWDAAQRVLTVALRKGQTATTALSCFTDPSDVDLLGVWSWMRELFEALDDADLQDSVGADLVLVASNRNRLTQAVLDGGNEFVTPSHPITLTHAVQQPLGLPTFTRLPIIHGADNALIAVSLANSFSPITAWRSLGSHHTVLLGALQVSGSTTAAVDLEASWQEWIDDPDEPAPTKHPAAAHVERITLHSLDGGSLAADGTGERDVAVYIPQIDALWFAAPLDSLNGVPTPGAVAAPVHQLGDTKHRVIRYRATASSRFQEYFPEPGTICSRTGPGLAVDVPSSARPLAPDVAYVVPTFGWERELTTSTKTDVRTGNGLRVYLHRPWYSSGSGELLGVVLWANASPAPSDDAREASKTIFTQWGLDPAWLSGSLPAVPNYGEFPRAQSTATGLTLQESGLLVDVAGHAVGFDEQRRLWYCDIELDTRSAYTPFVRLALARYQPRSIAGVELSHVTLTDFAQLAPDRSAALTVDPADPRSARLVVAGLGPDAPTRSSFTATVETRLPDIGSDLGWAPAKPTDVLVIEDVPAPERPESVLLAATIRFKTPPAPGEFRLVVREFELIEVDPVDTVLSDTPQIGSRLVYATILPLDHPLEAVKQ